MDSFNDGVGRTGRDRVFERKRIEGDHEVAGALFRACGCLGIGVDPGEADGSVHHRRASNPERSASPVRDLPRGSELQEGGVVAVAAVDGDGHRCLAEIGPRSSDPALSGHYLSLQDPIGQQKWMGRVGKRVRLHDAESRSAARAERIAVGRLLGGHRNAEDQLRDSRVQDAGQYPGEKRDRCELGVFPAPVISQRSEHGGVFRRSACAALRGFAVGRHKGRCGNDDRHAAEHGLLDQPSRGRCLARSTRSCVAVLQRIDSD